MLVMCAAENLVLVIAALCNVCLRPINYLSFLSFIFCLLRRFGGLHCSHFQDDFVQTDAVWTNTFGAKGGTNQIHYTMYEGCPESIRPFWISREPVACPWCNLAASHRRPYCTSVNSHSPVELDTWQWDTVDWACVLCDRRIHSDRASRSSSSRQSACPFYSSRASFFLWGVERGKNHHITQVSRPSTAQIWLPATSGFSQS